MKSIFRNRRKAYRPMAPFSYVSSCLCCTVCLLTTMQIIGFLTPHWVSDSECETKGLFYDCCKNKTKDGFKAAIGNITDILNVDADAKEETDEYGFICAIDRPSLSLNLTAFILEITSVLCFLISLFSGFIECCINDDTYVCSCCKTFTVLFLVIGAGLSFSGCMVIVSDGHRSFGFSFWLCLFPGISLLCVLFLCICTTCCNICCGDGEDSGSKHRLSTCLKFRLPGGRTQRCLCRN